MGLYFNPSMSKDNMPFIQLYSGFSRAQQKGLTFCRRSNTFLFSVWHEASLSASGAHWEIFRGNRRNERRDLWPLI